MSGVDPQIPNFVSKVLESDTLRNNPSSRRLLKYLAEQELLGLGDSLKEYTIGTEAFGKDPGYDPRQDSTVRIQIGRLRQKLDEYYAQEGKDDSTVVTLPKGRLRLVYENRPLPPPPSSPSAPASLSLASIPPPHRSSRLLILALSAALLLSLLALLWTTLRHSRPGEKDWSPDLAALWGPMVGSNAPLLIAVGSPLFGQFESKVLLRDPGIDNWAEFQKSPAFEALAKLPGNLRSQPIHYYAAAGEVNSAFLLGQRLGPRQPNLSLVRSDQILWQQIAHSHVIFLGPPRFFGERMESMPMLLEIVESPNGFRILHPQPGESDSYPYRDPSGFFTEDGEGHVLVTHAAGPTPGFEFVTFASNSTFARAGAVASFTEPNFAKDLATHMRASGRIPPYWQVLLRVKFKSGVPTSTTYLLHRELHRR